EVVEALFRRAVVAGKRLQRHGHLRTVLAVLIALDESSIRICGALDQVVRSVSAELQHDVGRELIGGVLLTAEDRNFEDVVDRMPELMRDSEEQLSDERVAGRDTDLRRLLRQVLPYFLEIFVTELYGRDGFVALIPGVRDAVASHRLDVEIDGQPQRAEYFLQSLEHATLLYQIVDFLVRGILRSFVCNVDQLVLIYL